MSTIGWFRLLVKATGAAANFVTAGATATNAAPGTTIIDTTHARHFTANESTGQAVG
jgi:hypothetical protein